MFTIGIIFNICLIIIIGAFLEKNFTQTENHFRYTRKEKFLDIILVIFGVIASLCVILLLIIM